jgi:hypothetical protein
VPDVVSRAADFERLKVVSPLDVAIERRMTTADGNRDFDLSTDLEPESGIRSASHTG